MLHRRSGHVSMFYCNCTIVTRMGLWVGPKSVSMCGQLTSMSACRDMFVTCQYKHTYFLSNKIRLTCRLA